MNPTLSSRAKRARKAAKREEATCFYLSPYFRRIRLTSRRRFFPGCLCPPTSAICPAARMDRDKGHCTRGVASHMQGNHRPENAGGIALSGPLLSSRAVSCASGGDVRRRVAQERSKPPRRGKASRLCESLGSCDHPHGPRSPARGSGKRKLKSKASSLITNVRI